MVNLKSLLFSYLNSTGILLTILRPKQLIPDMPKFLLLLLSKSLACLVSIYLCLVSCLYEVE